MTRHVLTVVSVLWMLLYLATVAMWARSYEIHDMWAWSNSGYIQLHSVQGEVSLDWGVPNPGNVPPVSSVSFLWRGLHEFWSDIHRPIAIFAPVTLDPKMTVHWNFGGFIAAEHDATTIRQSPLYHFIGFPYWSFVAVESCIAVVLVKATWRTRRAARQRKAGHCAKCGYDLRAKGPLPRVRHAADQIVGLAFNAQGPVVRSPTWLASGFGHRESTCASCCL